MEKLKSGMLLYHGSYLEITDIKLSECSQGKDFGRGFYLTSSLEQAKSFVQLSVKRNRLIGKVGENQHFGYINVYEVMDVAKINDYYFESANLGWLHFVAGNRDLTLFAEEIQNLQGYNVIAGKIANDRTAATLQAYIDGVNGEPGDLQVDRRTIETLLPNRLEDQYCFKDENAISSLKFVKSVQVKINE